MHACTSFVDVTREDFFSNFKTFKSCRLEILSSCHHVFILSFHHVITIDNFLHLLSIFVNSWHLSTSFCNFCHLLVTYLLLSFWQLSTTFCFFWQLLAFFGNFSSYIHLCIFISCHLVILTSCYLLPCERLIS